MEVSNEKFGKFIKELRQEKGITQKELSKNLNITDKAISKWERGLSFPDVTMLNTLSDFFKVDVSELLNGDRGTKEEYDIDKVVQEAIEKYKGLEEKRKKKIKRIKKHTGIISIIIFIITLFIQLAYIFIFKKHNFEYVIDALEYIINETIIISATLSLLFLLKNFKNKNTIILMCAAFLTIINVICLLNNGLNNKCIISFSSDFSNELVLKVNKENGTIKLYGNTKYYIFAKEKEQFSYEAMGTVKKQWLSNDICVITYMDKDKILREFVATYGDRGNGISYYYVSSALEGHWQVFNQYGTSTRVLVDSKGITVTKKGESQLFEYSNCKQYGTIALVLYKNNVPKFVIGLDENCKIDEKTNIIKRGGTITLAEISMEKTSPESLYCMTYKNENDLSNYHVVSVGKEEFKIQNGIMYISYDGINTIEIPADFSEMNESLYTKDNYQISEDKTIFYFTKSGKKYLVYSNDMGKNWNTVEVENKSSINDLQFINSNIGYMLLIKDTDLGGIAWGKIVKTTDGGKTWTDLYDGIGNEEKIFKASSHIKFINEQIGFLTMPKTTGERSEIYITKNGGMTFNKLTIISNDIYDYYNMPTEENGVLKIKIGQGSDGDYNDGDFKTYISLDFGERWTEEK